MDTKIGGQPSQSHGRQRKKARKFGRWKVASVALVCKGCSYTLVKVLAEADLNYRVSDHSHKPAAAQPQPSTACRTLFLQRIRVALRMLP